MNKETKISIIILVVGVLVLLVLFFVDKESAQEEVVLNDNIEMEKKELPDSDGLAVGVIGGDPQINQISIEENVISTDNDEIENRLLSTDVNFGEKVSIEEKNILKNNIEELSGKLHDNSDDFISWLELAMNFKIAEDYAQARDIWEYMKVVYPNDSISSLNLASLYRYNFKDFEKAKENFEFVLKKEPNNVNAHLGLYELHRYSYNDIPLAENILINAIENVANNFDLIITLAGFYEDLERNKDAIEQFERARGIAINLNNEDLVNSLEEKIRELNN